MSEAEEKLSAMILEDLETRDALASLYLFDDEFVQRLMKIVFDEEKKTDLKKDMVVGQIKEIENEVGLDLLSFFKNPDEVFD